MTLPQSRKGFSIVELLVVVVVLGIFSFGGYLYYTQNFMGVSLEDALNNTSNVSSMHVDYGMDVKTSIGDASTGTNTDVNSNVDGYMTGGVDGEAYEMKMSISNDLDPTSSLSVTVISDTDGNWYTKTAATGGKWVKYTSDEYEQEFSGNTIDASLFGINILGTMFDGSQAVFGATTTSTVVELGEETVNDVVLKKYKVEISVPDFIESLWGSEDVTEKDISDSEAILAHATISAVMYVNEAAGFVERMVITANNLEQIIPAEYADLGYTSTHNIVMTADLSRFGVENQVTIPTESQIVTE